MFFKLPAFERLLKNAYKTTGIEIMHNPAEAESYILKGGFWIIWLRKDTIPKEALGTIIKYCGELPAAGSAFKVRKDETHFIQNFEKIGLI